MRRSTQDFLLENIKKSNATVVTDISSQYTDFATYHYGTQKPPAPASDTSSLKNFSQLDANIFATILENCYNELCLVANINHLPNIVVDLHYTPLSKRFNDFHYNEDYLYDEEWQRIFAKFKRDMAYIKKVIFQLIENLRMLQTAEDLAVIIKHHHWTQQNEMAFINARNFNKAEILNLRELRDREKKDVGHQIQDLTTEVGQLKDIFNDSEAEYSVKFRYLQNWEKSRQEQNKMLLDNITNGYTSTIESCQHESEQELRVHEEIATFIQVAQLDYQEEIKLWMEKYDTDIEERDMAITRMKARLEHMQMEVEDLQKEFDRRQVEMEEWIERKRRIEEERIELVIRTRAACKIQAWWRAVMIRKKLGPYSKKKKKKGKGKNSGKKKKK